ncbi:MAG: glycosyltransferase, partial [Paludibacteraceae bacterium]|nr:glycosyltransferase [Paludibacteraceae bacterium]
MHITLPISKSIAQRQLVLRALRGEDLRRLPQWWGDIALWPEDVQTMYHGLLSRNVFPHPIDLNNDGTAMRFLTAYYAQMPGADVLLDGCERMRQRPMQQLIVALRQLGADITCMDQEGYAPLHIRGRQLSRGPVTILRPQSSQFVSALLLIGVEVITGSNSPYISMTREMMRSPLTDTIEADWSAAAFWLEREALGWGHYQFTGLNPDSWQGDKVVVQLFSQIRERTITEWDFSSCPDLYPAAAVACFVLGLQPRFTGLESLRWKESDRLAAIEKALRSPNTTKETCHDHRLAMAFMAAGWPVDDTACIAKSYPAFADQLLPHYLTRIVPRRGINDDNKGKKWALHKMVPEAPTDFVWLTDDDIAYPPAAPSYSELEKADMVILPLRMQAPDTLLGRLQVLEYTAIQELTMRKAKEGKAVMCAGANLIVRKQAWLACEHELHPELPSGDDMFMLEAMKRRGMRVVALDRPEYEAVCTAAPDLKSLLRQRMRWAGKAPHYVDHDIVRCMTLTALSNLMVIICPLWFIAKWLIDMHRVLPRLLHVNSQLSIVNSQLSIVNSQ